MKSILHDVQQFPHLREALTRAAWWEATDHNGNAVKVDPLPRMRGGQIVEILCRTSDGQQFTAEPWPVWLIGDQPLRIGGKIKYLKGRIYRLTDEKKLVLLPV